VAIFRIYTGYEPLKVFSWIAVLVLCGAAAAWSPFPWSWLVHGDRSGHLQSIILGGVLPMAGIQIFDLRVLADLMAPHRMVMQRTLERVRRIELELGVRPSHYQQGGSQSRFEDGDADRPSRGQLAPAGGQPDASRS
jgi:hypothetical protein